MLPEFPNLKLETTIDCSSIGANRIYDYWLAKCDCGPPSWAEIDLMDVYQFAPHIMIKEYDEEVGDWRNRFFGSGLTSVLGIEGTGKLLGEYHSDDNAEKAGRFFDTIRNDKMAIMVAGQCIVKDQEHKDLEGVYLPLVDEFGKVNMVFCYEDYS